MGWRFFRIDNKSALFFLKRKIKTVNFRFLTFDLTLIFTLFSFDGEPLVFDNKKYHATQVEISGSEKYYGIAADENMIAVYRYGGDSKDSELIAWVRYTTHFEN